jgi:hypothetical protein
VPANGFGGGGAKKVDFGVPRFAAKRDNCFGITQLMPHPMIANLRARA